MMLIVGTGRCGTSVVAHAAATRLGYDFGNVGLPSRANPLGAYECRDLRWLTLKRRKGEWKPERWRHEYRMYLLPRQEPAGVKVPELGDYLPDALHVLPESEVVWAQRDLETAIASRVCYADFGDENRIADEYEHRLQTISDCLADRRHLALDMNRRWTTDEIAATLHEFLRNKGVVR